MTAYTHNTGGTVYFDALASPSVNATLDTHSISNNTVFTVRTDTYACANHSTAAGSLDTVSFSGIGGTLHFDPTYVRYVAYTGGSGNSPTYGAAISQGGVSGVFLGAWNDWLSEPIAAGAAISATGFIKIGGTTGGGGTIIENIILQVFDDIEVEYEMGYDVEIDDGDVIVEIDDTEFEVALDEY